MVGWDGWILFNSPAWETVLRDVRSDVRTLLTPSAGWKASFCFQSGVRVDGWDVSVVKYTCLIIISTDLSVCCSRYTAAEAQARNNKGPVQGFSESGSCCVL